jgi:hypothetical protein
MVDCHEAFESCYAFSKAGIDAFEFLSDAFAFEGSNGTCLGDQPQIDKDLMRS